MRKHVYDSIAKCQSCIRYKPSNRLTAGLLQPLPIVSRLFQRMGIDIVGPLELTQDDNRYILVIVDYYSHWAEAFPIATQTSKQIADLIVQHIITRFGCPEEIVTDQGKNLLSTLAHDVYEVLRAKKLTTTPYHPQTNGLTERTNGILKRILSHFVSISRNDWDLYLPYVLYAYRTSPSQALGGLSPFEVLYGQKPRQPLDQLHVDYEVNPDARGDGFQSSTHQDVVKFRTFADSLLRQAKKESQVVMKNQADKRREDVQFAAGDIVYLKIEYSKDFAPSLAPLRKGPYRVVTSGNKVNSYQILDLSDKEAQIKTVNVSKLTRASFSDIQQIKMFIQEPDTLRREDTKLANPPTPTIEISEHAPLTEKVYRQYVDRAVKIHPDYPLIMEKISAVARFAASHASKVAQPVHMLRHFLETVLDEIPNLSDASRKKLMDALKSCQDERSSLHDVSRFVNLMRHLLHRPEKYLTLVEKRLVTQSALSSS